MWEIKHFKSAEEFREWEESLPFPIQWERIFVENQPFSIEYRRIREILPESDED